MKRSELKERIRLYVPSAKIAVISDSQLNGILQSAIDDVNQYCGCLVGGATIDVTANTQSYNIISFISDFYAPGKTALQWYNGTEWKELVPKTRKELNEDYPYWRNAAAGDPIAYVVEMNNLIIHPKPLTSLAGGFRFDDYIKAAPILSSDDQYPFSGTTTEMANLRPLDDVIIDYCRWKLALPLGKDNQAGVISQADYEKSRYEKSTKINVRNDILFHRQYKMRARTRRAL